MWLCTVKSLSVSHTRYEDIKILIYNILLFISFWLKRRDFLIDIYANNQLNYLKYLGANCVIERCMTDKEHNKLSNSQISENKNILFTISHFHWMSEIENWNFFFYQTCPTVWQWILTLEFQIKLCNYFFMFRICG